MFNFNTPDKGVVELGFNEDFDQSTFHPHGISVLQNADTGKFLIDFVNQYLKVSFLNLPKTTYVQLWDLFLVTDFCGCEDNSFG